MRLDLAPGVDGAGRVRRRHEQERLGALGAGRLELVDGDPEAVVDGADGHRNATGQGDRLREGDPVGRGDEDLVARVEQGGEGVGDGLLAAVGDQHLVGGHPVARVAVGLGRDRLPQRSGSPPAV